MLSSDHRWLLYCWVWVTEDTVWAIRSQKPILLWDSVTPCIFWITNQEAVFHSVTTSLCLSLGGLPKMSLCLRLQPAVDFSTKSCDWNTQWKFKSKEQRLVNLNLSNHILWVVLIYIKKKILLYEILKIELKVCISDSNSKNLPKKPRCWEIKLKMIVLPDFGHLCF